MTNGHLPNGVRFTRRLLNVLIAVGVGAIGVATYQSMLLRRNLEQRREFQKESMAAVARNYDIAQRTYDSSQANGVALDQVVQSVRELHDETRAMRTLVESVLSERGPERNGWNGDRK